MQELTLITPGPAHAEAVADYKREFERCGDNLDGTANLGETLDYDEWLAAMRDNARQETARPGMVPASIYMGVRNADGRVVGFIDIRHELNDALALRGGHIGYSVRPSERRKGYAKEMLRLALDKCRALGLDRVLVTCSRDNPASAKTILANGGVLQDELTEPDRVTQRYWITL